MRFLPCPREKELAEHLECGHWPHAAATELRTHVDGCPHCRDLVRLMHAMRESRAAAASAARLQPAGVLWWRAQLRRRRAAVESIERPMLAAQVFAAVFALAAAAFFLASRTTTEFAWLRWLEALPRALHLEALLPGMQGNAAAGLLAAGVVFAVIACGAAAYAGLEKR